MEIPIDFMPKWKVSRMYLKSSILNFGNLVWKEPLARREAEKEPKPEMVYFPVNVSGLPMNQESYKRMWDFYYEKYHYSGTPSSGLISLWIIILATKKNKLKREIEEKSRNVEKKRRIPVPPTYRTRKLNI